MSIGRYAAATALVGAILVGATASAEAGLKVGPSRVVLRAKSGEVLPGSFLVENDGEAPMDVHVEPEDWSGGAGGDRGSVPWLTVRQAQFTAKPGERLEVTYQIRVPEEASGELRAQVFFSSQAAEAGSPRARLGVIIYVAIEGTVQIAGEIAQVRAFYAPSTPEVTQPDRLEVVIGVRNRGNTHVVPTGHVVVLDAAGQAVARVPVQSGWGLLSGEEDSYRAIGYDIHLKPGAHRLEVTIVLGDDVGQPTTITKTLEMTVGAAGELQLQP